MKLQSKMQLGFTALLFAVLAAFAGTAKAAVSAGIPVDINLINLAAPKPLNIGDTVPFKITVMGTGTFQVGISGTVPEAPIKPSHPVANPAQYTYVWSPGKLVKGKPKTLTFSLTVQAPSGATGPGMWCTSVVIASSLKNGPPA